MEQSFSASQGILSTLWDPEARLLSPQSTRHFPIMRQINPIQHFSADAEESSDPYSLM
jgi:hypothetical protein